MRARRWLIGAVVGSAGVGALVATRALRTNCCAAHRPVQPDLGWATCSAPGARTYEATFGRLLGGLYRAIAIDLRDSLAGQACPNIVDIGAGPGGLAVALAEQFPHARVTTIDIDATMATLAAARVARERIDDQVHVTVGDVAALPLADASVDLVTSSFSVRPLAGCRSRIRRGPTGAAAQWPRDHLRPARLVGPVRDPCPTPRRGCHRRRSP